MLNEKSYRTAASFILTEKCTLKCKYCFECMERDFGQDMTEEVAQKSLDFLFSQAIQQRKDRLIPNPRVDITLFGGEPLMMPELCDFIVRYGVKKQEETLIPFSVGIITNGTIMTDKIELMFRRWKSMTNFHIQVSLDGTKEAQDLYRVTANGTGSFDTIAKNIPVFESIDPSYCLHGCINKKTMPLLFESYKYFIEEFRHRGSIWFLPIHEEDWTEEDVIIYDEQLSKIFEYETQILNTVSSYTPIDKLLPCGGSYHHPQRTCGAGNGYITFCGNGDIYPCHNFYFSKDQEEGMPDYKLGNVFDENPLANEEVLKLFEGCYVAKTDCRDCKNTACYRCLATNYTFNKDIYKQVGFDGIRCKLSSVEKKWQDIAVDWADNVYGNRNQNNVHSCHGGNCKKEDKHSTVDRDNFIECFEKITEVLTGFEERLGILESFNKEESNTVEPR